MSKKTKLCIQSATLIYHLESNSFQEPLMGIMVTLYGLYVLMLSY